MRIVITVEKNGRKSLANGYVHNVDVSMKIHIVIGVAKKGLTDAGEPPSKGGDESPQIIYAFGDKFLCWGRLWDGGLRKRVPCWSFPTL